LCDVAFGHGFWTPLAALLAGEGWLSQKPSILRHPPHPDLPASRVSSTLLSSSNTSPIIRGLLFEAARRFNVIEDDRLALQQDYLEVVFHEPALL
jgi:hypothetical protein